MAKIIENMIKNNININDEVISVNMLSAGKLQLMHILMPH